MSRVPGVTRLLENMVDSPGPSFKCCSMCMRHCFETHRDFLRSGSEALFASPAFFILIRESHVTRSKFLRIPELVMENLNRSIGDKLNLKGSSGFECEVTVKHHHEGYVLQSGFNQFMNHYDLEVGDSLVFTLVADSTFLVKVFGKCGSEKTGSPKCQANVTDDESVPRSRELNRDQIRSKECLRQNGLDDVSNNLSSLGDTREGSSNLADDLATRNKLQVVMHKGSTSTVDKNEKEDIQTARCSSAKIEEFLTKHSPPAPKVKNVSAQVFDSPRPTEHLANAPARSGQKRKQPAITAKEQEHCLRNAALPLMDSLKNPYQFCIMTDSQVNTHHNVFLNKLQNLPKTPSALTVLDSNEKQYTVSWIVTSASGSRLGAGWKQFVLDQEIKVGDACVFEQNSEYMLTVYVFHLKDYCGTNESYQQEQDWCVDLPPKASGRSNEITLNSHRVREDDKTSGNMATPSVANRQAASSSAFVANRIKKKTYRPREESYSTGTME